MASFDYANAPVSGRDDIAAAQLKAWQAIGQPGSWLTGAQRVAVAAEVRNAPGAVRFARRARKRCRRSPSRVSTTASPSCRLR